MTYADMNHLYAIRGTDLDLLDMTLHVDYWADLNILLPGVSKYQLRRLYNDM